jgi:hypothetical protein
MLEWAYPSPTFEARHAYAALPQLETRGNNGIAALEAKGDWRGPHVCIGHALIECITPQSVVRLAQSA